MAIFLARRWTRQPTVPVDIDYNCSLLQGVRVVAAANAAYPISPIVGRFNRQTHDLRYISDVGVGIASSNGVYDVDYQPLTTAERNGGFMTVGVFNIESLGSGYGGGFFRADDQWSILALSYINSTGSVSVVHKFSNGDNFQVDSTKFEPYTYRGAVNLGGFLRSGEGLSIIVNGQSDTTATTGVRSYVTPNMMRFATPLGFKGGLVFGACIGGEHMTLAQATEITKNPFAILKPQRKLIFSLPTAPEPTGTQVKVYNGTAWETHPIKVYLGGSWTPAKLKKYNGSTWEQI